MFDYYLFDLDGTLTDPKVGIVKSVIYSLESFGISVDDPESLTAFIGPPIRQSFRSFCNFDDENVEKAVKKFRERYLDVGIYENVMYDGVDRMLQALTEIGKTLIIATSKPIHQAKTVLEYFNLFDYFTFISGSEVTGERSDKSEVILYALEQNNIDDLSRCVMIGDRKYDIIGAKTVGLKSIGVLYGHGDYAELSDACADYIVKNVDELSSLLLDKLK